jgi:Uma2 family endonuclease
LFKNKTCNIYFSDLRVQVEKTNLITYPDLVITCGEEILRDSYKDTILNPKCIIEVLSESTEKYDRGDKFSHYQKIESLEEYILVSQDTYKVESFLRSTKETWVYTCIEGLESVLAIQSIGGEVSLGVVYSETDDL